MKNRNYWVVSPNVKNNEEENSWKDFLSNNPYSFIGWDEDNQFGNTFINTIKKGDVIINAQRKNWKPHVFGIGIVLNNKCEWQKIENTPSGAYCRQLNPYLTKERVSKLNIDFNGTAYYGDNKQIPALYQLHPHRNENDKRLVEIIEKELEMAKKEQDIQMYVDLLKTNKNIILTGAPGTGKTFLAKQIAKQLIGVKTDEELEESGQFNFVQFHPSYDYTDFVEGLRPTPPDENGIIGFELKNGVFKEFCKKALDVEAVNIQKIDDFSISGYEQYLNALGLNSKTINNYRLRIEQLLGTKEITSKREIVELEIYKSLDEICDNLDSIKDFDDSNKMHRQFTSSVSNLINFRNSLLTNKKSASKAKPDFVFVIDEINRGEISKIFGELFFSIDPSYRGKKGSVKTQYSNLHNDEKEVFYVPENVYIIGSMNDIDRSVESFDFAMRRRFTWIEITAEQSADNMDLPQDIKEKMLNLNKQISDTDGLNPSYHIGAAYFLDSNGNARQDIDNIWYLRIEPLLKEYLRGMPDSIDKIELLKNAFTA